MTLLNVSQLRNPSERVPLGERYPYEDAMALIEDGAFEGYELLPATPNLQLKIFWNDKSASKGVLVEVSEQAGNGAVHFRCEHCGTSDTSRDTCEHQWGSFILLWQAMTLETSQIANHKLAELSKKLKEREVAPPQEDDEDPFASLAGTKLDSISLFLEDAPLLKGAPLGTLLDINFSKYKAHEVTNTMQLLSPQLWNMPEVFRRKLTAYSEHYFNEVNEQTRLANILRYNFSNGMQISAREILRHPLQRQVPRELLPLPKKPESVFAQWPLTQQKDNHFISQALKELEEIIQTLLANVARSLRQGQIELYVQTKNHPTKAMRVQSIEFDPNNEVDWRVEFVEKKDLEAEFKLMSFRKQPLYFFDSFAVEKTEGVILVHPWFREWSQLTETLSGIPEKDSDLSFRAEPMPTITVTGELESKIILKYLRSRTIPVKLSGESRTLGAHQSQTEIQLSEGGEFFLQQTARVMGQKDLARKGWTPRAELYLQTLSQGLPYLLNTEAKDVATRARGKRDWDLKLLRNLGVLQYLMLEILSFHFDGTLTDGTPVKKEEIFPTLHEKIQALLVSGTGVVLARDMTLTELCSKSVLFYFEDFVTKTLETLTKSEAFYSEQGEVVLEGVVEREFRVIYELLKKLALSSGGEAFKKSRTSFLAKIWTGDAEKDTHLNEGTFHFPKSSKDASQMHETLEALQALIPYGFKIFFKGQPLQELNEDEFHIDFVLQTDAQEKFFNWFELNPRFFLRGEEIDPDNMGSFGGNGVVEYNGKLYLVPRKQMPSLRRLENFWQKLQKGKGEASKKENGDKFYRLPRHQILELLALRSSGVAIRGSYEWDEICAFYDQLGTKSREFKIPSSVKAELKPYQETGVLWLQDLYKLRLGALLADDMGLGKTLQTLTFLDDLREKGEMGQVLIVVPSSLIFNWQSEVEKFTPKIPLTVFSNKDRDAVGKRLDLKEELVVITTYGLLMEHEDFLNQYKFKILIFDEAQNLKNITTKRTSAARSLTAQFKICLTGTPMENHYGEFYSLVDILVPGSLGKIEDFRRQFVNTEMVTREEMEDLKLKIKPLLLRRTKKEILDQLPEKQETKVSIAFEERQKEIYRDIALSYNQKVQETFMAQGEASVQLQMLTALLRLRQACSDPAALPNVRYEKVPPKLEALLDSLKEIVESGESALVFTQFLQTLEHTASILKTANIPVFVLHGGVPTKQRQKILSDFNKVQGGAVLVMTLKTGGVGLNLTKASYVFHLEPWWNPSVENQATDRAHRLGQSKAVQVFRYIMHESLEEKIEILKDRKDRKFQTLFANTEKDVEIGTGSAALSKADFDLLLGLK
ncbi:DEAD/DEAH box helicase [Bdellovibrio svalbardensis]|uniref:DEAD/DEAH box helicase n=1 Tax=Bdellovibrio svalbardensis TaxID=2972972 RepID=A0ABT6DL68_9BACT|nr:DEAD/DEAH box helicase [Bdellovibrio svalbardensis]MDG0817627.1 DEAD/DEAH box helicase [Bdellovibrio svalbardensis]